MEMEWWMDLEKAMEMDSSNDKEKKNLEYVQLAIQRLMEQRKNKEASAEGSLQHHDDDDGDDQLLSKLLSQLESLKGDASVEQPLATTESKQLSACDGKVEPKNKSARNDEDDSTESESDDEIVKELKKVRKQNTITHWLLSIMILLTVTWQLSEVSLFLMVKDRVTHPFRSFASMLAGMLQLKGPDPNNTKIQDDEKQLKHLQMETPSLPHLAMPEIPPIELPALSVNGGEDR